MTSISKKTLINDIKNGMYKFKFHIKYDNKGTNRIFLNNRPTSFYISGPRSRTDSALLAQLINEVVGERDYKDVYIGESQNKRLISNDICVSGIIDAFKVIKGKLEHLYSMPNIDIYEIDFSKVKEL